MRHDGHFSLARDLGMHLHDLLGWHGPMTRRQFLAWQAWIVIDLDRPDKNQWYMMKCAAETRRSWVKNKNAVKPEHMKLEFNHGGKKKVSKDAEKITREAKADWAMRLAVVGKKGVKKNGNRNGTGKPGSPP